MSLELCILASGSGGNCTLLRSAGGILMIDAGIGPRTAARRMQGTGVVPEQVRAICLTHLDSDHFNPNWVLSILRQGIRLYCHRSRVEDLLAIAMRSATMGGREAELRALVAPFDGEPFSPLDGVEFRTVHLPHDEAGSHGFLCAGRRTRIGYATDLGRVPPELLELFGEVDVLALESNYDPEMELASARPWHLKQRIMNGRGHLSNQQSLEAVCQILDRADRARRRLPRHIVLLHRSRQCNCPDLLRKLFETDRRIGPRLVIAEQNRRTEWLHPAAANPATGEQLCLSWG